MNGFAARFDALSDWLSPILVKEVRQMVRGRGFNYTFGLSLLVGLLIAFFGGANALSDEHVSGVSIFASLMGCLCLIGLIVVPLGTFNALRQEWAERTLDLVTITNLSPRRIVIGKLLSQSIKLVTLWATLSPFVATSFLLGGIDFLTIVISLSILFMVALWFCAACIFLSSLSKSRVMSGFIFVMIGIVFLITMSFGRAGYYMMLYGSGFFGPGGLTFGLGGAGSRAWWDFAGILTVFVITTTNLVLLAENRLSLPTENRTTALRLGFFVQFFLILGWQTLPTTPSVVGASTTPSDFVTELGVLAGIHLALVSLFTVTEDLDVSRRALIQTKASRLWLLRPGGGRGAAYILLQMTMLLLVAWFLAPSTADFRWVLAICSYICFFTGVPAYVGRMFAPARMTTAHLRAATFLFFPFVMLMSEVFFYFFGWSGGGDFSVYHIVNPLRALSNWSIVEQNHWYSFAFGLGVAGVIAYLMLIRRGESAAGMVDHVATSD
jgi:hypothetical protein